MDKWKNTKFESSSTLTPEFASFAKDYKAYLKKSLKDFELVKVSRNHFYLSGFVRNLETGKLAYFNTSDVRYSPEAWNKNVLVRTATSETDYTGGSNNYSDLVSLRSNLLALTK